MSTYASIYDVDNTPISEAVEIGSDADFAGMEIMAAEIAASGIRCCIRWERDNDGQVAYWGARGATLTPYWY